MNLAKTPFCLCFPACNCWRAALCSARSTQNYPGLGATIWPALYSPDSNGRSWHFWSLPCHRQNTLSNDTCIKSQSFHLLWLHFAMVVGKLLALPLVLAVVQAASPQIGIEQKFLCVRKLNAVLCSHGLENPKNAIASENPVLGKPVRWVHGVIGYIAVSSLFS